MLGSFEDIMKLTKWHVIPVGIIVIGLGAFFVLKNGKASQIPETAVRYKEYVISRGTFRNVVTANGTVLPIDRVEIKSKASGLIQELPVEEGDVVHKGDLICRLDPTDVQAEVDQAKADFDVAQAELKQAQNSYDRQHELYTKGLLSDQELDQADLQMAQAKGKLVRLRIVLEQANIRLSETIVRSPISGIVLQKYVEVGQIIASGISNVSGGTLIIDVADMDSVYIEAGIDEIDVGKIHIGQSADVIADAYPDETFTGEIIRLAPESRVVQNVTLFDVVIKVVNKDRILKSGMNAQVEITIVRQDNVLLVPTLVFNESQPSGKEKNTRQVLLKKGDRFIPQKVEIGLSNFESAVITSGLQEGDTIGVLMTSRLKEDENRMEERIKSMRSFGTQQTQTQTRP